MTRHDPVFYRRRELRWWSCSCGTTGPDRRTATAAQLDYGRHLLAAWGTS